MADFYDDRALQESVDRLNYQLNNFTSNIATLSESILQHSDFLKRSHRTEEQQRTEQINAEANYDRRRNALNEKLIELENKRVAFQEKQLESSNNANTREEQLLDEHYNRKAQQFDREEEQIRRQLEILELEAQGQTAEAQARANYYEAVDEENQVRRQASEEQRRSIENVRTVRQTLTEQIVKVPEVIIGMLVGMETQAIDAVTRVYEQTAGKLSAMLDTSVSYVSNMQNELAKNLREQNLNNAISNVQVLEEANRLASSGYTNTAKLEQNATDIQIAREVAPTLDIDNRSVKNLINVFGSDFTTKFAGIASAVQDSASSMAAVQSTLGSLMTDLEPVFLNAELQSTALQSTADVEATLSAAQEQGIIGESEVAQYRSMLVELMDPTKALTSSNIAVRAAATDLYSQGSNYRAGDMSQALEAILGQTSSIMNSTGQSNTASDVLSRGFLARSMGLNTMTAEYNNQAYTNVDMVRAGDLSESYQQQVNKLQDGAYTTQQETEQNVLENADITQHIADFAEEFPKTYQIMQGAVIAAIQVAASRITNSISNRLTFGGNNRGSTLRDTIRNAIHGRGGNTATDGFEDISSYSDIYSDSALEDAAMQRNGNINGGNASLLSRLSSATTVGGHEFIGSRGLGFISSNSAAGLGQSGTMLNTITGANLSGLGIAAVGVNGIYQTGKMLSYAFDEDNKDQTLAQKLSYGGDIGQAMTSGAGMGAAAGALVGTLIPGIGNAVGAAVGGLAGAIGGLITATIAQSDTAKQQKEAMEAQTQATKDLLGEGIKPLTALEKATANQGGKATMAIGNDTYALADFSAHDYASVMSSNAGGMDFVPYDGYLARLHKGEAVVTAKAAESYRRENPQFYKEENVKDSDRIVDELSNQTTQIVDALTDKDKNKPIGINGYYAPTYEIATQGI